MIAVYILLGLAVLTALAAWLLFGFAVSRKGIPLPGGMEALGEDPWDRFRETADAGAADLASREAEDIWITSADGLKLHGRYLRCRGEAKRLVLCAHGYRAGWLYDFCCSAPDLLDGDSDVLLIDQRSHGESEGRYICYGVKERQDIKDWCLYCRGHFGAGLPLYLMGLSMGCATILMAAGLDLPENVKGLIADCGYTSPKEEFEFMFRELYHLPLFPLLPLLGLLCRTVAGFDVETSTLEALKKTELPILFVHGDKDDFVPTSMGVRNYEAYEGPKELFLTEGIGHAASYVACREEYARRMQAFFSAAER